MADRCTPGSSFPNSDQMVQISTNLPIVWTEICAIQQAILAAASLCPPGTGQMCTVVAGNTPMTFVDGILSIDVIDTDYSTLPSYQGLLATAGQTIFNTLIPTIAQTSSISYLLVFVNGVMQMEGAGLNYIVSGTTQITFTSPLDVSDNVAIYAHVSGVQYEQYSIAAPGQTEFNTTLSTGSAETLLVYVNGVMQLEGAGLNYQATGPNQITFGVSLEVGDDLIIFSYTSGVQYQAFVSQAAQTVFNTSIPTNPIVSNVSYTLVAVNGVMQMEGVGLNFTVTGSNQLTFTYPLSINDNVSVYAYTSAVQTGSGLGYFQDSPAVVFVPPVGVVPITVASASVTTNGGNILSVNVTNGGLGYEPVPSFMTVVSPTGANAIVRPLVNAAGGIVVVDIVNGGAGYTVGDTVTATRAVLPNVAYVNAVFAITSVGGLGEILEIVVLNPGSGYQDSVTEVSIVSSLNPLLVYPLGTGLQSTVLTDINGTITQVIVNNAGAGYAVYPPYLVITDPGTGATTRVILTGASVSAISVLTPGTGYTQTPIGTVFNPPTAPLPNPPATPAVVNIIVAENIWGTNPSLYWQVWAGVATNRPIQLQINQVLSYFKGLGYTIIIQSNPLTNNTMQWKICW